MVPPPRACTPVLLLAFTLAAGCGQAGDPSSGASAAAPEQPAAPAVPPEGSDDGRSRYTALAGDGCGEATVRQPEGVSASWPCAGVGGYALVVHESDARMSIDVVAPEGGEHPLDLWHLRGGGFSGLGDTAEWRLSEDGAPVALIVRHEVYTQPERATSYLVVVGLSPTPCLVALVEPGPGQNLRARSEADLAPMRACRSPREF